MKQSDAITLKLQKGGASALVGLSLDHVLSQPLRALLDPSFMVDQIVAALSAAVEGDRTEKWARDVVLQLLERAPDGSPRQWIPQEALDPLRSLASKPVPLDQQLVRTLIGHEAVEAIFRDVVTESIQSFTDKLKKLSTGAPQQLSRGLGALKGFRDRAMKQTPLGGIAQVLESQAQRLIRDHVERSILLILDRVAEQICSEESLPVQASYRLHLLDSLIDADNAVFLRSVEALGVETMVDAITSSLRSLLRRPDFRDSIAQGIQAALDVMGEQTVAEMLAETGMDHDWRSQTEEQITRTALDFIGTDGFKTWLGDLLDE
jgi:hypothetical protein